MTAAAYEDGCPLESLRTVVGAVEDEWPPKDATLGFHPFFDAFLEGVSPNFNKERKPVEEQEPRDSKILDVKGEIGRHCTIAISKLRSYLRLAGLGEGLLVAIGRRRRKRRGRGVSS